MLLEVVIQRRPIGHARAISAQRQFYREADAAQDAPLVGFFQLSLIRQ